MSEKGKIIIRKNKKGKWIFEVDIGKKQAMMIPQYYDLRDDSLNGKECEVERDEKGRIVKITIDGKELSRKAHKQDFSHKPPKSSASKLQHGVQQFSDSFDIQKTKLPSDTRNTLQNNVEIDNFSLKLNKAARFENEKFEFFKTDKERIEYQIKANFSKNMVEKIVNKHYSSIEKLNLKLSEVIILKPDWRLIVGLGNESVYETSMTLHHIYGIPYIPGSAIKGVIRSYIITEEFNSDEKEALRDEGFCVIFGSPKESKIGENRGTIIFFDAYPLEPPKIEPDVMNVHYPDYYGDNKPPVDYQNPRPIYFLTVKETPFQFILGIKERYNIAIQSGKFKDKIPLEVTYEYMKKALSEHGIGAKTAVGYGYMNA